MRAPKHSRNVSEKKEDVSNVSRKDAVRNSTTHKMSTNVTQMTMAGQVQLNKMLTRNQCVILTNTSITYDRHALVVRSKRTHKQAAGLP